MHQDEGEIQSYVTELLSAGIMAVFPHKETLQLQPALENFLSENSVSFKEVIFSHLTWEQISKFQCQRETKCWMDRNANVFCTPREGGVRETKQKDEKCVARKIRKTKQMMKKGNEDLLESRLIPGGKVRSITNRGSYKVSSMLLLFVAELIK